MKSGKTILIVAIVATVVVGMLAATAVLAFGALRLAGARRAIASSANCPNQRGWGGGRGSVQGKTLAETAKEKGVDEKKLIAALVVAEKARLDVAVTMKELTQDQAGKILEAYKATVKDRIEGKGEPGLLGPGGGGPGCPGGGGPGCGGGAGPGRGGRGPGGPGNGGPGGGGFRGRGMGGFFRGGSFDGPPSNAAPEAGL